MMTLVGGVGSTTATTAFVAVSGFFFSLPFTAPASGFSTLVITSPFLLLLGCILLLAMVSVVIVIDIRQGSF